MYPKDTEKWKQFTTCLFNMFCKKKLFCIPKILKNESNSQPFNIIPNYRHSCFVSQRYWKMKAIHNNHRRKAFNIIVVLYPKDTEKWKQFTTKLLAYQMLQWLFCIPKILKNESNSQPSHNYNTSILCCFVSQRYWKMKAIHNSSLTTQK